MIRVWKRAWPGLVACAGMTTALSAQEYEDVEIETIQVSGNVYMLVGQGGNIGLSVGRDGAFLIDDQFAPLTEKISAAVKKVRDEPIRFVINTHWHSDHTGGNENLGKAGSIIVAHENVRKRMSKKHFFKAFNREVPPSPEAALPVITFTDSVTFHFNDDEVRVLHVEPAHTDGDSIVHFRKANVLHMGDTYFNGMYPFIDASSGGSIDGMISAVDRALGLANKDTKIIPGHGAWSTMLELRAFQGMLKTVRGRMGDLMDKGKSREEIVASKPTKDLDEKWGGGFMEPDAWVGIVYDGMAKK